MHPITYTLQTPTSTKHFATLQEAEVEYNITDGKKSLRFHTDGIGMILKADRVGMPSPILVLAQIHNSGNRQFCGYLSNLCFVKGNAGYYVMQTKRGYVAISYSYVQPRTERGQFAKPIPQWQVLEAFRTEAQVNKWYHKNKTT